MRVYSEVAGCRSALSWLSMGLFLAIDAGGTKTTCLLADETRILGIAGTGSNCIGRGIDGTTYRAGGWGPALGDEGSGFWIGQEALRAGFWAKDRGITTSLLIEIGAFW